MYDVVVVGAGINGLSCVYHLLRRGVRRIALLEQLELLHHQGSSHGFSRITRSTYSDPRYVELVTVAHREDWPELSRSAGRPLLHPRAGCFFGPNTGPYLDSYAKVPELDDLWDVLTPPEARKIFPIFRFPDSERIIHDRSCAVVAAADTMAFLAGYARDHGCELRERCCLIAWEGQPDGLRLKTSTGDVLCSARLVVTAGAWSERLFPSLLAPRLRVAQQHVGYFRISGSETAPVWVYAGEAHDESFYGLPEFGRPGIKVARHRTGAHTEDPDRDPVDAMPEAARADLEGFAAQQLAFPVELVGYEGCLYTNTPAEDFLLDRCPGEPRIVIGAGFSGHGFKFGPLTGRILAGLSLDGETGIKAFERHRAAFAIPLAPEFPA